MAKRTRVRVRTRDRGWKRIKREINKRGRHVLIGVQGQQALKKHGDGEADDPNVATVGALNEFGVGVPERSFLRATIVANEHKYRQLLKGVGDAAVAGKTTLHKGVAIIGEVAVGDVKQRIADGIPPPNAEETIERKGSSTPLIDQGQLRGSITKAVKRGARAT